MVFILTYDDNKYQIKFPLNGEMSICSNPFFLKYIINYKFNQRPSQFETTKEKKIIEYIAKSEKPLKEIDGLLVHEIGIIKVEIKKGKIYLMDKSIEDYL